MLSLEISLLCFMAIFLIGMVLVQGFSRRVDLFSLRNMFLCGFIIYQLMSPALALYTSIFPLFEVYTPQATGKKYTLFAYVFLAILLFSYHRLKFTPRLATRFSKPPKEVSDTFFLGLAMLLVCLAVPLRLIGPSIAMIKNPSVQVAIAMAAVACAIAGWVWGNRRFNPAVIVMMIFIVGSSLAIGMFGVFGRRPLLSILMGFAWGAYHRRFKQMTPARMVFNLMPIMVFVALAVAAFTAIRENGVTANQSIQETMVKMTQADVSAGAENILSGQACGAAALWCVENYPHRVEPRMLFTLKFMPMFYIPRTLWEDKPLPLAIYISTLARVDGVARGKITLPPGIIGYAAAEGGMIAIVLYGLFFGQFLRFFDELVRLNPYNPFIILPVGCASGQVLGLARGDIAIFANLVIMGFIATYLFLSIASKLFGNSAPRAYYQPWPQPR